MCGKQILKRFKKQNTQQTLLGTANSDQPHRTVAQKDPLAAPLPESKHTNKTPEM